MDKHDMINEMNTLKLQNASLSEKLGNLLAVIHGDGGHHEAEVGTEKAVQDAIEKWYALQTELDNLRAQTHPGKRCKYCNTLLHERDGHFCFVLDEWL